MLSFKDFLAWHMVNLIFYKLFIRFDIPPISADCIMEVVGMSVFQASARHAILLFPQLQWKASVLLITYKTIHAVQKLSQDEA